MKKLLDELQAGKDFTDEIFNDTPVGKALKEGFEAAFNIVRAHNPWHEVSELPPKDAPYEGLSIYVLVKSSNDSMTVGYYDFEDGTWELDTAFRTVTHWAYLPEAKP